MNDSMRLRAGVLVLLTLLCGIGCAKTKQNGAASKTPVSNNVVEAIRPAFVKVEYWLQYDKGEAPAAGATGERCPSCGQYHSADADEAVKSERPIEQGGVMIAGNRVVTSDPVIEARFIAKIVVRSKDSSTNAKINGYSADGRAAILELDSPLAGAAALTFDTAAKGPYQTVKYSCLDGDWSVSTAPLSDNVTYREFGRPFLAAPALSVIVDSTGKPLTITSNEELPPDGSWKIAPEQWKVIAADAAEKKLAETEKYSNERILRATLNFRSPKTQTEDPMMRYRGGNTEDDNATVRHVLAIAIDPQTVLVLSELKPKVTSRLEKIRLFLANGQSVQAEFVATLADYGAFIAKPAEPLTQTLALSGDDVRTQETTWLPAAKIYMQGETRVCYPGHRRISGYDVGWRQNVYPEVPGGAASVFLFAPDGKLLALPIAQREKAAAKEEYSYGPSRIKLTAASQLIPVLSNVKASADASNVPLSEDEESRLAWLGVELQPLTAELARANNVSSLTNDGESGALVNYVYEGSPSAKAGIKPGAVLLRIHNTREPKPIDISVTASPYGDQPFPWDRLDQAPEEVFDRIPQPWPNAENAFTRTLTDMGLGAPFKLEYSQDGKTITTDLVVEQSPAHFNAAAKYKSVPLGVTVREITYEVRRYLQRKADEPGVIVSKIEIGSKASKAGLKPFEVVTHVNDAPVNNIADFEKLTQGQDELKLTVKRMTKGRIVKVSIGNAKPTTAASTTGPSTAPVASPTTAPAK